MIRKLLSLAGLAAAVAALPAFAETVKVGRASIELPEGTWKALTTSDGQNTVNGSAAGALPTETGTFAFVSGGRAMAILSMTSSKNGGTRTNWVNTCKSSPSIHALNLTEDPNALECVQVSAPFQAEPFLMRLMPDAVTAMLFDGIAVPLFMQSINVTIGSSGGTSLHVNLYAAPDFVGLQGEESSALPAYVKPGQLVWARQLAKEIKGSVYSMSGNMTLPPVAFATPRVTSSTSQ
jgi:hypothetical protein